MKWGRFLILCIVAVSTGYALTQKIESKNGLRVVHNESIGSWGNNAKVRLDLIKKIGGLDTEDEHLSFRDPAGVAVDSNGCLYILDRGNDRIQKLSNEARFIRSIGRHGQGPAEFQFPASFTISPDDRLYIMDYMNRRIQILTSEGRMERAIKLTNSQMGGLRLLKSGNLVIGGRIGLSDLKIAGKKFPNLLTLIDPKNKILKSFGEFIDYGDLNVNSKVHWFELDADKNDNIYICFDYQNRLEKYTADGILSWRADRKLNYGIDVIDKGFIKKTPEGGLGILAPGVKTVSHGIAVDKNGRIWVITQKRQLTLDERRSTEIITGGIRNKNIDVKEARDIFKLEIFDQEGFLLGEIPINIPAMYLWMCGIYGEYLFLIDAGDAAIYQYRIIEN